MDGAVASGAGMKTGGGIDDGSRPGLDRRSSVATGATKASTAGG